MRNASAKVEHAFFPPYLNHQRVLKCKEQNSHTLSCVFACTRCTRTWCLSRWEEKYELAKRTDEKSRSQQKIKKRKSRLIPTFLEEIEESKVYVSIHIHTDPKDLKRRDSHPPFLRVKDDINCAEKATQKLLLNVTYPETTRHEMEWNWISREKEGMCQEKERERVIVHYWTFYFNLLQSKKYTHTIFFIAIYPLIFRRESGFEKNMSIPAKKRVDTNLFRDYSVLDNAGFSSFSSNYSSSSPCPFLFSWHVDHHAPKEHKSRLDNAPRARQPENERVVMR